MPSSSSMAAVEATLQTNGIESVARPPLSVALHVPISAVDQVDSAQGVPLSGNPNRRSHIQQNITALPTLPEASHVNALNTATGPAPAALGLAKDLDSTTAAALNGLSPAQKTLTLSRSQGYDLIVLELANERWKERWERLCLANPADLSSSCGSFAAQPSPLTSVQMSSGAMLARSSSRQGLNSFSAGGVRQSPSPSPASSTAGQTFAAIAREAEDWRKAPAFKRSEVNLSKLEETEGVIALASQWIELDSPDEGVRLDCELALRQELAYASYLGISNVVLPPPSSDPARRPFLADYARAINSCLSSGSAESAPAGAWMTLAIQLPISSPHLLNRILSRQGGKNGHGLTASTTAGSTASASSQASHVSVTSSAALLRAEDDWAWETWEQIRQLCSYNTRLQVALDLGSPLPGPSILARWMAEPVSMLWVPTSSYLANAKGFPVLSKASQAFFRTMFKKSPTVVLSGVQSPPPTHSRGGPLAYLQYVRHLEKATPPDGAVDSFARGYTDWLQAPLQPLMDNLEGTTYEVFERDPVKYALYEEAVYKALLDRSVTSSTLIWVCGAGRGPLVDRCLNAADRAGRSVRLVALEKNQNALVTLQERQALEWGDQVKVQYGDMRRYPVPSSISDRPDIVVSELLGSFGDNELSPECLDGAMRFLKPNGISIPSSYTAFLSPLSSSKLHTEVLNGSNAALSTAVQKSSETPYVVLFQNVALLAARGGRHNVEQVQESWTFEHRPSAITPLVYDEAGLPATNGHNIRSAKHTFHIPQAGTCHGLAGYFEAHLYDNVTLSIHPDPVRGSKDMLSWFPIYFPFREPIYLPGGSELDLHMWRMTDGDRVWYEWCGEAFLPLSLDGGIKQQQNGGQRPLSLDASSSVGSNGTVAGEQNNFSNAPNTPKISSVFLTGGHQREGSQGLQASAMPSNPTTRVKIGMTKLHNPGGRSSWIGL
ncbi:related to protein arginine N-methyltransferase [Melanopsichium pennsylvanicum]|uniref:Related to protein arginine N-methyltransferase n=2 Tax=Melanopsichium pennsylvanicum TaxID=63383 RepID=A0AAJ4XHY4_9BASI|nr:related to protein arginine N-methyltransferase [Melanopsichium pennsylvanicum 4]SNX82435.1 related to protein arginine N-methyltransferase [Melanopsichium pennsylvanicum]